MFAVIGMHWVYDDLEDKKFLKKFQTEKEAKDFIDGYEEYIEAQQELYEAYLSDVIESIPKEVKSARYEEYYSHMRPGSTGTMYSIRWDVVSNPEQFNLSWNPPEVPEWNEFVIIEIPDEEISNER